MHSKVTCTEQCGDPVSLAEAARSPHLHVFTPSCLFLFYCNAKDLGVLILFICCASLSPMRRANEKTSDAHSSMQAAVLSTAPRCRDKRLGLDDNAPAL